MAEKRRRPDGSAASESSRKKTKHGFRVGPAHLPDGTYKRHNDKVKKGLIERAQIKKQYAKMKRNLDTQPAEISNSTTTQDDKSDAIGQSELIAPDSATTHPDRVDLMSGDANEPEESEPQQAARQPRSKARRSAFDKQSKEAERRKAEAEARHQAWQKADRDRAQAIAQRERHRKIMAKAHNAGGQRKLGRESTVLLDRVKNLMSKS